MFTAHLDQRVTRHWSLDISVSEKENVFIAQQNCSRVRSDQQRSNGRRFHGVCFFYEGRCSVVLLWHFLHIQQTGYWITSLVLMWGSCGNLYCSFVTVASLFTLSEISSSLSSCSDDYLWWWWCVAVGRRQVQVLSALTAGRLVTFWCPCAPYYQYVYSSVLSLSSIQSKCYTFTCVSSPPLTQLGHSAS